MMPMHDFRAPTDTSARAMTNVVVQETFGSNGLESGSKKSGNVIKVPKTSQTKLPDAPKDPIRLPTSDPP